MKTRLNFSAGIFALGVFVFASGLAWAQEYSHVRIVRLSFEEGTVNLQRPNVPGVTEGSVNMPIQEGFVLSTDQGSFAEVEFENTSTARVGQLSQLVFNQLALDSNGNKLNGMELQQGYATFTVFPENNDVYQVRAASLVVTPDYEKGTQFRVDVDGTSARVEVFKGTVEVTGSFGVERVSKNNALEFDPDVSDQARLSHGLTKDAWDDWVEQREEEAQLARRKSPPSYYTNQLSSYMYGWNDLYYYGSWSYVPGYGSCWIPTTGPGWVPFSYGQWVWYPGFGYTWVSYEPWGWIPFHYGNWTYVSGYGWAWVPGGFGAWAPAPVSWYQGQTWVAWSPRPLRPRPGGGPVPTRACPDGGCTTVVSQTTFRNGLPVQGRRLPGIDVTASDEVARPTISPADRFRSGAASGSGSAGGRAPAVTEGRSDLGAAADSTGGRIVYDPRSGGFVNGRDSGTAAPTRLESPSPAPLRGASADSGQAGQVGMAEPGPRPLRGESASSGFSTRAPEASHHASPRSGTEPPRTDSTFVRTLNTYNNSGSSSSGSSRGSSSGGWTAPSSSSGGWSGGSSGSSSVSAPRMSTGGGGGGGGRSVGGGSGSTPRGNATPHR